jgi:hypothetical protein
MKTLSKELVFTISDRKYCWHDVVAAAERWGEWSAVEDETRLGIACSKYAQAGGNAPDPEEVAAAVTEFRYDHNLISADETEEWLRRWGLTIEDLMTYVECALLRERWSDRAAEILARFPTGDEEFAQRLEAEAV